MGKVSDGIYLMYVKDETMYPVALTEEQWNMLQLTAQVISKPMKVIDKPLGKALPLAELNRSQHKYKED